MRKQIAAANWKMNLTYQQAEKLLSDILDAGIKLEPHQLVLFGVPFPYLIMASSKVADEKAYSIAAQNCSDKASGAYTGEVSAEMLQSIGIRYCIIGHSERREYFGESNKMLADKLNLCLQQNVTPVLCLRTKAIGGIAFPSFARTISNPHYCLRTHMGYWYRPHGYYRTGTRNAPAFAFSY